MSLCSPYLSLSGRLLGRVWGSRRLSGRFPDLRRLVATLAFTRRDLGVGAAQFDAFGLRRFAESGPLSSLEAPGLRWRCGLGGLRDDNSDCRNQRPHRAVLSPVIPTWLRLVK